MIRKRDRVVGTLAIWSGTLFALAMIIDRLYIINIQMQNFWYYTGSVVTGGSSEEAMQALQNLQSINNQLFTQVQQVARAELLAYAPLILILCLFLIAAAVISTWFIWRSVAVTPDVSERVEAWSSSRHPAAPLARLLNDDGEIIPQTPERNHKRS